MTRNGIILLLALGASAEVPHWMAPVKQTGYPSVDSIMAPIMSFQNKLVKQTSQSPNSRRLMAIMSEECNSACPGAKDMVMAMMEMASAETTPPPDGMDPSVAMMMALCDHVDAIVCVGTTKACQDEEPKEDDDPAAMKCICKCPNLLTAATAMGKGDFKPMCDDKSSTVGCVASSTECASMAKDMDPAQINLLCAMDAAACMEKQQKMGECMGDDLMTWGAECEPAGNDKANLTEVKDICCPMGKKIVDCMDAECIKLGEAAKLLEEAKEDHEGHDHEGEEHHEEDKGMEIFREVCPDAGLPTEAEIKSVSAELSGAGPTGGDETASSALAAPAQAASVVAMVVTTAALFA